MSGDVVFRAGRLGSFAIDGMIHASGRGGIRAPHWVRRFARWRGRRQDESQRERDAELGRLVRALLALGGMVCRLDGDDGPLYVVEVYGDTQEGETPLLVGARDPETGLRETLAQLTAGAAAAQGPMSLDGSHEEQNSS